MLVTATSVATDRPRVDVARLDERAPAPAATAAWLGVCALTIVAPFEALRPLVRLPGQSVSSVETALLVVFTAWVASLVWTRTQPHWRTPLSMPWTALVVAMLVAALGAPVNRTNALNMVGRMGLAFGVYLLTVNGITTRARLRSVLIAAGVSGTLVASLVILEYLEFTPVLRLLRAFRPFLAHVGAQVRAGGPFQYPTIASMYLEIVFALVLAIVPIAIDERRHRIAAAAALVVLVVAEAITLTFTRAGLITMASSLVVVGALRVRRSGFDRGAKAIAAIALLVAVQFFSSRSFESLRLRMTTEGQDGWYLATIGAPSQLTMRSGERIAVPLTLTNSGSSAWHPTGPHRFRMSYHWLLANDDRVVSWEGLRTDFPDEVAPGETIMLRAAVEAPRESGEYRLLWDVEQEDRLWFSTEPGASLVMSRATVSGSASSGFDPSRLAPLPRAAVRPSRFVLWGAAAQMLAERPITGVGPDNFRLQYGPYAGLARFDTRVHSNNMYLEMLVGGGLLVGLAFAWLCWAAARQFAAAAQGPIEPSMAMAAAGVAAAGVAIALHGLVDSFVSFTGTYVLISVTLGLASASGALGAECQIKREPVKKSLLK